MRSTSSAAAAKQRIKRAPEGLFPPIDASDVQSRKTAWLIYNAPNNSKNDLQGWLVRLYRAATVMNRGPSKEEVLIAPLVFWRMSQEPEAVTSAVPRRQRLAGSTQTN
jgi:hypothetical protein